MFFCWRRPKTASARVRVTEEEELSEPSAIEENERNSNRVPACLTIPPEPSGPAENAERRMRNSPKYRSDEQLRARYSLGRVLGAGGSYTILDSFQCRVVGFAVVRIAKDKESGRQFACKTIILPKKEKVPKDQVSRHEVFQEIEIASGANHPNIVAVREFFITEKKVSLIMDYMEGGMVLDSLLNSKQCRYTENDARGVMNQVLSGLQYLHARNVAHRDLKLENILLAQKNDLSQVKIVDFGLSKHTKDKMTSVLGTPQFVSPEMLSRSVKQYDKSVDMWSAGVLLYIFLSGFPPFYDKNEQVLFKKILSGAYKFDDPVWEDVSDNGKDLIKKLLVKDAKRRFTASQALAHSWFSDIEDNFQPLQETRSNLLRLRRAEIMKKANRVLVELDRFQFSRTDDNIHEIVQQLQMEEIKLPNFILEDSDEDKIDDVI